MASEIVDYYGDNVGEELFCIPRASSGAYLSSVLIEARMKEGIPILRLGDAGRIFEPAGSGTPFGDAGVVPGQYLAGAGAARRERSEFLRRRLRPIGRSDRHLAAADRGESVRRTPFVVELRNIPFRNQEQVLFYIADRLPRFTAGAMDARGNGQYLAETAAQRYGGRIVQVMLSEAWYRENMPRYKAAFEDGTIEIPKDADILRDHRAIVVEHGVAKISDRRTGGEGKGRHGDSAMAAALAFFATRAEPGKIGYIAARGRGKFRGAWGSIWRGAGGGGRGREDSRVLMIGSRILIRASALCGPSASSSP